MQTRFLSRKAMFHMLHFGESVWDLLEGIEVNQELNLALYNYFQQGEWDVY